MAKAKGGDIKKKAMADVFLMAFDRLGKEEKLMVIEKILARPEMKKASIVTKLLKEPKIREDLYDLFLIEQSKKVRGKYTPLDEYLKKKKAR